MQLPATDERVKNQMCFVLILKLHHRRSVLRQIERQRQKNKRSPLLKLQYAGLRVTENMISARKKENTKLLMHNKKCMICPFYEFIKL